jgi:hypothetical protein
MKRLSQLPGLDTAPTGGGAPPAEGSGAPQSSFNVIYSPLDSLGKILADLDFKTFLENHFGDDPDQLAHKIWVMYGGDEDELGASKKGEREDEPQSSDITEQNDIQQKEYNETRKTRWMRLPKGVGIDEITDTGTIKNAIIGGFAELAKSFSKPASASAKNIIRLANIADSNNDFIYADKLDLLLKNVYSS